MKKNLKVSKFSSENNEREFWSKINLTDYFEVSDFETASFPNLIPSSRSISIRLPEYLLIRIKEQANELDVPYQSLMKQYIAQGTFQKYQKVRSR
ncbi:MAG: hypothetical protein US31_C0009G0032 [Berkelbacteria bacterium GW2011_GWA1_36_9]|uniref:Uncharacterized protein n=1 Tax=Berkelbacteria bacterium GW2011_GWA1_36_9 TaxID=1618331 RepID=A0A0G0FGH4_9BACT|nr:MAG: hypothetical protein US31_C0009G0032 [Berkelbacteria bacterium GW2011_GWA1_36_9]